MVPSPTKVPSHQPLALSTRRWNGNFPSPSYLPPYAPNSCVLVLLEKKTWLVQCGFAILWINMNILYIWLLVQCEPYTCTKRLLGQVCRRNTEPLGHAVPMQSTSKACRAGDGNIVEGADKG